MLIIVKYVEGEMSGFDLPFHCIVRNVLKNKDEYQLNLYCSSTITFCNIFFKISQIFIHRILAIVQFDVAEV